MIPIKMASNAILDYLSAYPQGFRMANLEICPPYSNYPKSKDKDMIFCNNPGMGIVFSPRPGRDIEYYGLTHFSIQQGGDAYWKCALKVSISQRLNQRIHDDLMAWKAEYGHTDIALKGAWLNVIEGDKGKFLALQEGGEWFFENAWEAAITEFFPPNGQTVREFNNGVMVSKRAEPLKKIITHLWGDKDIYDQDVVIPAKGGINFKKESYTTLEDLFIALIESPSFIRLYDEMDEETFALRAGLLSDTFNELENYRNDWEPPTEEEILDEALKVLKSLQPKVHPVNIPTPTPVTPIPQQPAKPAGLFAGFFNKK